MGGYVVEDAARPPSKTQLRHPLTAAGTIPAGIVPQVTAGNAIVTGPIPEWKPGGIEFRCY